MAVCPSSPEFLDDMDVVLVKIGGSSITHKAKHEALNHQALEWFSKLLIDKLDPRFSVIAEDNNVDGLTTTMTNQSQSARGGRGVGFIVVHGAGSFGHFEAKKYGLRGQTSEATARRFDSSDWNERKVRMNGLAKTRISVQKLNRLVVSALVEEGINAVGISPCFGIPKIQAHAGSQPQAFGDLCTVVKDTLAAGLVPCLHGDAGIFGDDAAILSGDTIVEMLGQQSWIDRVVFITDVDGVFTEDPRSNPDAKLLRKVTVEQETGKLITHVDASTSSHEHDVTGGLKVSIVRFVDNTASTTDRCWMRMLDGFYVQLCEV